MKQKILVFGLLCLAGISRAQQRTDTLPTPAAEREELRYNLNASGSHYFQATFSNQLWLRYDQSNPGTTVNGQPTSQTVDVALRSTRIQMFGQITDHAFIYFQFGLDNFNYLNNYPSTASAQMAGSNRKNAAFFHDVVGEYLVFSGKEKEYLKLGGGLTVVGGTSRLSQPSVSSVMTLDVPVFAQATVDQTDLLARKLSVYARGQIGKIDYRVALSDPFPLQSDGAPVPTTIASNSSFALQGHHKQYQGMVMYQFFDKESNTIPGYTTGTYLGKKKVFNLEAGLITQRGATWRTSPGGDTLYNTMTLWSVGAFYDAPLNRKKGTALSAYAGYFNYNYGPGYLRYNGVINPANGTTQNFPGIGNTYGNTYPMYGTGHILYGQVGLLLPQMAGAGQLMPYVTLTNASYQRLTRPLTLFDIGLNWFLKGHHSKFSLDYQSRPVYQPVNDSANLREIGRRSCLILQYQIFI